MTTQHIDDFFRTKEAAFIPDMPLPEILWQQFRAQLQAIPPAPPSVPGAGGIIKIIGGLLLTGAVTVALLNKSGTAPTATPATTPVMHTLQDTNPPVKAISPTADTTPVRAARPATRAREFAKPAPVTRSLHTGDTIQRAAPNRSIIRDTTRRAVPRSHRIAPVKTAPVTDTVRIVTDTVQATAKPGRTYSKAVKPAESIPVQPVQQFAIGVTNNVQPVKNTQYAIFPVLSVHTQPQEAAVTPPAIQFKHEQVFFKYDTFIQLKKERLPGYDTTISIHH